MFTGRLYSETLPALTFICTALRASTSLTELDLSHNALGDRLVDTLVPVLTHCRSIQVLKLWENGLGPEGGIVLATALLESARLSHAEGQKSNLRTLVLSENRLEDGSAPTWGEAIALHGGLIEVIMQRVCIYEAGFSAIVRGLSQCKNLRILDLTDNIARNAERSEDIEDGWTVLEKALPQWKDLVSLRIGDCEMQLGATRSLIKAIASGSLDHLHTLDLTASEIEEHLYEPLFDAVTSHLPKLTHLDLKLCEVEEGNEVIHKLTSLLESRGGTLVLEDEDEEDEEEVGVVAKEEEVVPKKDQDDIDDLVARVSHLGV